MTTNLSENKLPIIRPSWDDIYMRFAESLAERSTCGRASVGSVIVSEDNTRVLAIGYNGNYTGGANLCDSMEAGNCGCIHAEMNSLIKLDTNAPTKKKLYTTVGPCLACAKAIINSGIDEVIYKTLYRRPEGVNLLGGLILVRRY